ncbi:MAG: rhodanese-like domain-containing protein [Verrucomicrobiota bacterium]
MARVPLMRFIVYDGLGAVVWASVPLFAGTYLHALLVAVETDISWQGALPWISGAIIVTVLVWRFWRRRSFRRHLEAGRQVGMDITTLKSQLDRGDDVVVLDIRDELAMRAKPRLLPRAQWIPYTKISDRISEVPLQRPIVVYCDCPHDEAAVVTAQWLRDHGAKDVRPLLGGLAEWIGQGLPTTPVELAAVPAAA